MPPLPEALPPAWTADQHVVLYHGSASVFLDSILRGINPAAGGRARDFGQGFYTTTFEYQAVQWANGIAKKLRDKAAEKPKKHKSWANAEPLVVSFRVSLAKLAALRSLAFVRPQRDSELYWSFICHCRLFREGKLPPNHDPAYSTHLFDHPDGKGMYDMVSGPVAARYPKKRGEHFQRLVHPVLDQFSFHTKDAADILTDLVVNGTRGDDYNYVIHALPS